MSRRLLAVGSAIGLLLPLAACGGNDPDTKPSPSTSASASPSPSASPAATSPPSMPNSASTNTKAGAGAFVRHYVDLYNYAQDSGETEVLSNIGAPTCESCKNVVDKIREIYDAGGHVEGGTWRITNLLAERGPRGAWLVTVEGGIAPLTVVPGDGSANRASTGGQAAADFTVAFRKGKWTVERWDRL